VTLACREETHAIAVQAALSCPWFRCYTQQDVIGVETAGALKNVIAIAVGISDGMDGGHNARAALMTRGLTEITRVGVAQGRVHLDRDQVRNVQADRPGELAGQPLRDERPRSLAGPAELDDVQPVVVRLDEPGE